MGNTNMPSEAQWVELNALLQKLFDAVDTDKTGKLSAANMEEAADKMVEHQMASQAPPEGLTEEQVKAAMDGMKPMLKEGMMRGIAAALETCDADHDGQLTLEEVKGGMIKMMPPEQKDSELAAEDLEMLKMQINSFVESIA